MTKMQIIRRVATQALRVPVRDRTMFVREQSLILGSVWNKDQDKLQELIHETIRENAFSLINLKEEKDTSRHFHFDRIKLNENGEYIAHEGLNEGEERIRQEKSSLTAEDRNAHQIFVVMSVYDDEICEEYQTQDEADIAASRFTRAVVIRRYSRKNGLEAEDWTYGIDTDPTPRWRLERDHGYALLENDDHEQKLNAKDPQRFLKKQKEILAKKLQRIENELCTQGEGA